MAREFKGAFSFQVNGGLLGEDTLGSEHLAF
jgi:hypothetical protein